MTREESLLQPTSRDALIHRNCQALEQRWQRPFAWPSASDAVRGSDTSAQRDADPVQIRAAGGNWLRVHSARDPAREATRWLDEALGGGTMPSVVCIIGAGLGFIIDAIAARSARTRILLLEPEPALVPLLLGRRDWTDLIAAGRLLVLWGPDFTDASEAWRVLDGEESPLILAHPVLTRERPQAAVAAARVLQRATTDWKANRDARERFAGRYLFNTLRNLSLFDTAGDVATLAGACAGTPAVIAAAGPSLNRNLDELAAIERMRERAVIVSVDTALRTCLAANLAPHFVVAVDPADANVRHLTNLPRCDDTWLVAEPSVEPDAFSAFEGRTLLFRVADHHPWPWLRSQGIDRGLLRVWGSVLTAAVDFALQLGCDPLIFVGADLAYTNNQPYCRGTVYEDDWTNATSQGYTLEEVWTPWLKEPGFEALDMHGASTRTTSYLIAFRDWLTDLSVRERSRRFVNASGAGVLSGGAFALTSVAGAFARVPRGPVRVPRPSLPRTARGSSEVTTPALLSPRAHVAPFEQWLASDPAAVETWSVLASGAGAQQFAAQIDASIDQFHVRAVEQADAPASAEIQSEIDGLKARLTAATTADEPLTNSLVEWLASKRWRTWPLVERFRITAAVAELYMRNRSALIRHIYPGLAEIFRSTLTPDLHVGLAAQLYDHLFFLRWTTTDDPGDLVSFRDEVTTPMSHRARGWASQAQLAPRVEVGEPPYRVAYLSRSSRFAAGDAVARVTLSLLRGHAQLASDRFRFSYYAWNGIGEDYRREVESLGIPVRVHEWSSNPCAAVARLRGALAADRIDVLLTDGNTGVPTALFASRAAPIQALLDMGFSAWDFDSVDYTFLGFAGDPERLALPSARYERIHYRFDRDSVYGHASPEDVAAQRARFGDASHVFGFIGRLVKLSPDYVKALGAILRRVPRAAMYLGGVADTQTIREQIGALGDVASRVVLDAHAVDAHVMARAIDTFLDASPFLGQLSSLQAQAAGRPVVFRSDPREGYAQLLALSRDAALSAHNAEDYADIASRLGTSTEEWTARAREAERIAQRMTDVVPMAAQVEDALERLLRGRGTHE